MTDLTDTPTPEMVAFYERRTNEHIERVRKCLLLIADATKYADELRQRAADHDVDVRESLSNTRRARKSESAKRLSITSNQTDIIPSSTTIRMICPRLT